MTDCNRRREAVRALTALALTMSAPAAAEDAHPAPATAPKSAIIPTSVFAARSPFGDQPQLSPDGKRIAYTVDNGGTPSIRVIDIDKGEITQQFSLPASNGVRWVAWAGNDRLLTSMAVLIISPSVIAMTARLSVTDLTTRKSFFVGPASEGLFGDDVVYSDPDGRFVLLSIQHSFSGDPEVWRFPLDHPDPKGEKIDAKGGVWHWVADDKGDVRLGLGISNDKLKVWYRKNPGDELKLVAKIGQDDADQAKFWDVIRLIAGKDDGYALKPGANGHLALRKFNYATREVGDVVYENPNWDLTDFALDADGKPKAVYFTDDQDRVVWLDPALAQLQADFAKALGGKLQVRILQVARDKSRYLIEAEAANDPGVWYVYTPATHHLALFSAFRPDIDPDLLTPVKPVDYTARDGTKIRAYLTLPRDRAAKGLPLVIMPHGGPYGVRDKLAYDDEVQLLANRGYAVLQPNYRGSSGFGDKFEDLGKGQIGRGMQDDLDDAMDWAVKQGIADPKRVCLVGGSYGGYAALWGVIRNPERYRCAASYAGVTDWDKQLKYDRNFFTRSERGAWHDRISGTDPSFDLDSVSPAKQAARLTRPILLGQGKQDVTVPFAQFQEMQDALTKARAANVQYLVLQQSAHGFADPKEEQAWFDALVAFLAKNDPAG